MPHALLVDDDVNFVLGLAEVVGREGFTTKTATSLKEARNEIAKAVPDVLLIDLHLPDGSGLDLVKDFEENAGTEIVLITGHGTIETAVEAMRHGASDYLVKPVDFARARVRFGGADQDAQRGMLEIEAGHRPAEPATARRAGSAARRTRDCGPRTARGPARPARRGPAGNARGTARRAGPPRDRPDRCRRRRRRACPCRCPSPGS